MSKGNIGALKVENIRTMIPPLREVLAPIESDGLSYSLREVFLSDRDVPGYIFDVKEDDASVGFVTILVTHNRDDVARTGHMGCELEATLSQARLRTTRRTRVASIRARTRS